MQKLVVVLIMVISFCSCKHDYNPPPDFNFSLSYGYFDDQISTFDSTFRYSTNEPKRPDRKPIKIVFTKEEMNRIYKKMIENDYFDIPDILNSKEDMEPCVHYHLIVYANSRKKSIYLADNTHIRIENIPKFDSITDEILRVLESKKEFKSLPPFPRFAL